MEDEVSHNWDNDEDPKVQIRVIARLDKYSDLWFLFEYTTRKHDRNHMEQIEAIYDGREVPPIFGNRFLDDIALFMHEKGYLTKKQIFAAREVISKMSQIVPATVESLHDEGLSVREIAKRLGMSKSTVGRMLKGHTE